MQFPVALQLRFLQTLADVATEKNSTIIFPVPIDLLTPFMDNAKGLSADKLEEFRKLLESMSKKD